MCKVQAVIVNYINIISAKKSKPQHPNDKDKDTKSAVEIKSPGQSK